jgi:hypothetical protein
MDSLRLNNTWDVGNRPTNSTMIDSKWVFKIKYIADTSINTIKEQLVGKTFSKIYGQDNDETVTLVVYFDSLYCVMLIIVAIGFIPSQIDFKITFLYSKFTETIYMCLPENHREPNKVAYLKMCMYRLK